MCDVIEFVVLSEKETTDRKISSAQWVEDPSFEVGLIWVGLTMQLKLVDGSRRVVLIFFHCMIDWEQFQEPAWGSVAALAEYFKQCSGLKDGGWFHGLGKG